MVRFRSILRGGRPGAAWLAAGLFCTVAALRWGWLPPGTCGGLSPSTVVGFALAIIIDPEI